MWLRLTWAKQSDPVCVSYSTRLDSVDPGDERRGGERTGGVRYHVVPWRQPARISLPGLGCAASRAREKASAAKVGRDLPQEADGQAALALQSL